MKQRKQYCERCIHFREQFMPRIDMGRCVQRKTSVNRIGFPCKFYELPPTWWQRIIRKLVKK